MSPRKLKKLLKVAKTTRKWAEHIGRRHGFRKNLCGLCAIASRKLFRTLKAEGFDPELALTEHPNGSCHVFVIVENHIVDITATQYRKDAIHVKSATKSTLKGFWAGQYRFKSERNLMKYQRRIGFCEGEVTLRDDCYHN